MPVRDLNSWKQLINGLVTSQRIDEAIRKFMEMPEKCQKTWNLIILGFIRCGLIEEAHAFLEKCPYSNIVSWTNVIVGYFETGEVKNAVKVFELIRTRDTTVWNVMIFGLGENDHGEDEMFLSSGRKEDAEKIWARMKGNGIKKQPGCSWIEINNSGHVFLSGDRSHTEFRRICFLLNLLSAEMGTEILKPSTTTTSEEFQIAFDGCYE
ncbi:hypothetical protein Q3G72_010356 [Acer saccharum]|nr:hypothetical protein Q3G72_010356 [Acer saccharum]